MLDRVSTLKREYEKELRQIEEKIGNAAASTEEKYITNFCIEQEKRVKQTQAQMEEERKKLREYIDTAMKKKTELDKLEFRNKLAVVLFLLEEHLEAKKNMEKDLAMLQKLGTQNELVKTIAESLTADPSIKGGLDEPLEIHEEFHRAIHKAKLGAFVDHNAVNEKSLK